MKIRLEITDPSEEDSIVEYRRHISVQGRILYETGSGAGTGEGGSGEDGSWTPEGRIPLGTGFTFLLKNEKGDVLREVGTDIKNNRNIYAYHPLLTTYPEEMDPGRRDFVAYGFPPLVVKSIASPMESLRDASIKAWFSDQEFKAMFVAATDMEHGLIFDDGMGFLGADGQPLDLLPEGNYVIEVLLRDEEGTELAIATRKIRIGSYPDVAIVRFNPPSHKARMLEWFKTKNVHVLNDLIPGYLDSYLGPWLYHKGLLPMYLAGDISQYANSVVHMFLYLLDPTSTSYSTELAFLEEQGVVENVERMHFYYYDIGEASLSKVVRGNVGTADAADTVGDIADAGMVGDSGNVGTRTAEILEFAPFDYLALTRIDLVDGQCKENVYDTTESHTVKSLVDLEKEPLEIPTGQRFAITGVVRPWQICQEDIHRLKDNTYEWWDGFSRVHYIFDDGEKIWEEDRKPGMERLTPDEDKPGTNALGLHREEKTGKVSSIGSSVAEFYNVFEFGPEERGRTIRVHVSVHGKNYEKARKTIEIRII
ncbi:MAG: hypothetical protein II123_02465 [Lachnospiraceae bacterium]|nr:hypothetical protein [Lachnospiraceae bacterium]